MGESAPTEENCVSCLTTAFTIRQLTRRGLPVEHLADGTGYSLEHFQTATGLIPWDTYLTFLTNSQRGVSDELYAALYASHEASPVPAPSDARRRAVVRPGPVLRVGRRPGRAAPAAVPLSGNAVRAGRRAGTRPRRTAPPGVRRPAGPVLGVSGHRVRARSPPTSASALRSSRGSRSTAGPRSASACPGADRCGTLLAKVAAWFRRGTPDDLRAALHYGHERSLRLEREVVARKRAEAAHRASEERQRRITDAVPGTVYQYYLDPDGRQGFTFVSGGAVGLTGYTPEELLADPGIIWRQVLPGFVPGGSGVHRRVRPGRHPVAPRVPGPVEGRRRPVGPRALGARNPRTPPGGSCGTGS
jgi:PAS domain-containing protein